MKNRLKLDIHQHLIGNMSAIAFEFAGINPCAQF
jgi:hypothetical protein